MEDRPFETTSREKDLFWNLNGSTKTKLRCQNCETHFNNLKQGVCSPAEDARLYRAEIKKNKRSIHLFSANILTPQVVSSLRVHTYSNSHLRYKHTHSCRNDKRIHNQNWWTEEKANEPVYCCNTPAPSSPFFSTRCCRRSREEALKDHQPYPRAVCRLQANMLACFHLLLLPLLLSRVAERTMGSFVPVCVRCDEPRAWGRTHNTAHCCHFLCWSREVSYFGFIAGLLTTHKDITASCFGVSIAAPMDFFFSFRKTKCSAFAFKARWG